MVGQPGRWAMFLYSGKSIVRWSKGLPSKATTLLCDTRGRQTLYLTMLLWHVLHES